MLIQFRFKNFASFRDETVFDMRAIKSYKEHPENLINPDDKEAYLKVASIYGANASGKSNFVSAYHTFKQVVDNSFSQNGKDEREGSVLKKFYSPFLFEEERDVDTEFEAIFQSNGNEYKYGFIYNSNSIKFEWLYKLPAKAVRKSVTTILERTPDQITLGNSVKKSCEKYIQDIDDDVLALSFFSSLKLKNSVFKDTIEAIHSVLPVDMVGREAVNDFMNIFFSLEFNEVEKKRFLRFLNAIDVQIRDIEVVKNKQSIEIYSFHSMSDGSLKKVSLNIESDGTKKAIAIYSLVTVALYLNKTLLIDELNLQLHPLLVKFIVDLFYEQNTAAQLIYTTHDTSLLDKNYTRRDQIWFADKDVTGGSSLTSLAEFRVRGDSSIAKSYLGGAFGGIPNISDFILGEE